MDGYYAFMLVASSLVLMMTTPALALFYGGMSRSKSVLNMMMMSFGAMAIVGIVYVLWGWSMSFAGTDVGTPVRQPLRPPSVSTASAADSYVYVAFQLTFAVITAALISGAIADRVKFSAWMVFVPIWVTLCYFPLAHMVWGGGFLSGLNPDGLSAMLFGVTDGVANVFPQDYAGGTVVHINAGMAGLVLALVIGKRLGFGKEPMRPHNLTLTMIGAGLLWFGWFGFNVGSIVFVAGDGGEKDIAQFMSETGVTWMNTTLATCAAMLGWLAGGADPRRQGHLAGRRVRRRRRPGRHHARLRRGRHLRRDDHRRGGRRRCAPTPSGLKYQLRATTTRSTWSASTWSAASSAPC